MSPADRVHLERLKADNAADAATLHANCFTLGWPAEDFRRYAEDAGYSGLFARLDSGVAAGLVIAGKVADEAEILTIATDPSLRRMGIAKRLLSAVLENLSGAGVAVVFLEVGATNHAAIALYQSFGFEQVGKRPAYYRRTDGREDALIMRRMLV